MKNTSGIRCTEFNVLVEPDEVKAKTAGGLLLPDEVKDKDAFGRTEGTIVDVSPVAFNYTEWPDNAQKPRIGDRVIFPRYQAVALKGRDGKDYWMMKDKAIMATMEKTDE